jgi:hypothetical protein
MLEAISVCGRLTGRPMSGSYTDRARSGITSGGFQMSGGFNRTAHGGTLRPRNLGRVVDAQAWELEDDICRSRFGRYMMRPLIY